MRISKLERLRTRGYVLRLGGNNDSICLEALSRLSHALIGTTGQVVCGVIRLALW